MFWQANYSKLLSLKTKLLRTRWHRTIISMVIGLVLFMGFSQLRITELGNAQASVAEVYPTEIASTSWQGGFFPVENFQSYTSPFGYRRHPVTGKVQFHNGLDMAAPFGSYVRNWWGGEVAIVEKDNACGTHVIIKSGGWEHVYCHLNGYVQDSPYGKVMLDKDGGIQLVQGQSIPAGTRIGRVGLTGRTTGPHLHWVLKHNGKYVDPALIIKEMFRQNANLMPDSEPVS